MSGMHHNAQHNFHHNGHANLSGYPSDWILIPPSSDVRSLLLAALDETYNANGGTIYLEPGTHVYPDADCIQYSGKNTTIRAAGSSSVILSHAANNQWLLDMTSPNAITARAINNTTATGTSIVTSTASHAGDVSSGDPIMVVGTDADGVQHVESLVAAANGNPSTGVITLTAPLTYTLTSATFRYYDQAMNNTLRDFKIVHDSTTTVHSLAMRYTYGCSVINVEGDGGGAVTGSMNFISILGNLFPTMRDCVAYDYNTIENYLGNQGCIGAEWPQPNYGGVYTRNNFDNCGNATLSTSQMFRIGEAQENCSWTYNTLTNAVKDHMIDIGSNASLVNCHFDHNTFFNSPRQLITGRNAAIFKNVSFNYNLFDTVSTPIFYPGFQIINPTYDSGLELIGNTFQNIPSEAANWSVVHSPIVSGNTVTNCAGPIYINGSPV